MAPSRQFRRARQTGVQIAGLLSAIVFVSPHASSAAEASPGLRLVAAYPDWLEGVRGNELVWKQGPSTSIDDGLGEKPVEDWLDHPDLDDMFRFPYPAGKPARAPGKDVDPGRARNAAFFDRMYGDCRKGEVAKNLKAVIWLPKKKGQRLMVTSINGVADRLARASAELDELDHRFDAYLVPSAGTYNCRPIAGTDRQSAHGHGIAIDIATRHSSYWRNATARADGGYEYRNEIPPEIVAIFEKHGFIWGGRWHHYDTMHFEYRPELLPGSTEGSETSREGGRHE
jgi:hypothetical protein